MGPADLLEGKVLEGKWRVVQKMVPKPTDTGGHFSTGYIVEEEPGGRRAFMKAMDYVRAFSSVDHVKMLNFLTSAYLFEKNICQKCQSRRLDRVVHAIESFTVQADPANPFSKVECLVFELASGDVRRHLSTAAAFDTAFRFRALHHVATGLQQLHGADIAHQDLKPSNVLVFGKAVGTKISDFGRAWSKDFSVAHDNFPIAGDRGYAPPELLFDHVPGNVHVRRFGCDLYHLGSLASFFFTTVHMNGLLIKNLDPAHHPYTWTGGYPDVLPYLQAAFATSLGEVSDATPAEYRRDLTTLVSYLCQPDPEKRGHPANGRGTAGQFGLERFISRFDYLATTAEVALLSGKK